MLHAKVKIHCNLFIYLFAVVLSVCFGYAIFADLPTTSV